METNSSSTPMSGPTIAKFINDPDYDPIAEAVYEKQLDYFADKLRRTEPGLLELAVARAINGHQMMVDTAIEDGTLDAAVEAGELTHEDVDALKATHSEVRDAFYALRDHIGQDFMEAIKENAACQAIARNAQAA